MKMLLILVPALGAVAGWLMISLAFRLMFEPEQPVRLGVFGFKFRGVLPKKRKELEYAIGQIIRTQLQLAVTGPSASAADFRYKLTDSVATSVREYLENRLPVLIPARIKNAIIVGVVELVRKEIHHFYESFSDQVSSGEGLVGQLEEMAQERIRTFDLQILYQNLNDSQEFKVVKLAAAGIGLLTGLLQLLVVWLAGA